MTLHEIALIEAEINGDPDEPGDATTVVTSMQPMAQLVDISVTTVDL